MKITPTDFKALNDLIISTILESNKPLKEFAQMYAGAGHSDRRFMFDWLYATPRADRTPLINSIYSYANDDHIHTALKKIFNPLHKPSTVGA